MAAGRALDALDMRQGARQAMAPADLCRQRRWRVGEILLLGNEPFRLVGCYESGGDPARFVDPRKEREKSTDKKGKAKPGGKDAPAAPTASP